MSRWCNTCHHNEYQSCNKDCVVFGKNFEELAEIVIKQEREIDALRWTNKLLIKVEKEKRRKLWVKAVNQFAEMLKNRHYFHASCVGDCYQMSGNDIDNIVKEMTRQ